MFFASMSTLQHDITPQISDLRLLYYTNTGQLTPASAEYKYNYFLAVSTDGIKNNIILLFDDNGKWTMMNGVNAQSICFYKGKLYIGDSVNGNIYIYDSGNTDNGADINGYYTTKDFDFGYPDNDKMPRYVYVHIKGQSSGQMTVSYATEQSGNYTTLSTEDGVNYIDMTGSGMIQTKMTFPSVRCKYMRLKFQSSSPFTIYKAVIYFDIDPVR
jgi:hypothetical protein